MYVYVHINFFPKIRTTLYMILQAHYIDQCNSSTLFYLSFVLKLIVVLITYLCDTRFHSKIICDSYCDIHLIKIKIPFHSN